MLSNSDPNEYSEKEKAMLRYFGIDDILLENTTPITLYRMAVEKAFMSGFTGPYVDSLRRCAKALNESKIYRMTPEWEALIKLDNSIDYTPKHISLIRKHITKARKELEDADAALDKGEIVTDCSWAMEHCMEEIDAALAVAEGTLPLDFDDEP